MGKTILLDRWILRLSVSWTWCFWIHFCFLHILYQTLNFSLSLSCLSPLLSYRPEPCRPTRSRGLGDCEPSSISFGILLVFFFFRFIPEGLSESVMTTKQQIWEILPGGEKGQMYPDVEPKTMPATAGQVTDSEAGDPSRRVQTWASRNSDCTWFTSDFLDYLSSTKGKAKLCLKWQASWSTFQLFLVLHLFSSSLKTWKEITFTHYENLITILVTLQ